MSLSAARRDRFRRIVQRHRSKPGEYGLRVHTVEVRIRTSSGTHTGDGTRTGAWVAITERNGQPPKVRQLNSKELTLGDLGAGTIEIGPITPECSVGGTDLSTLLGRDATTGQEFHIRITGPMSPGGATYRLSNSKLDRALRYMIQAEPVAQ